MAASNTTTYPFVVDGHDNVPPLILAALPTGITTKTLLPTPPYLTLRRASTVAQFFFFGQDDFNDVTLNEQHKN